jgi:hypothetical protein
MKLALDSMVSKRRTPEMNRRAAIAFAVAIMSAALAAACSMPAGPSVEQMQPPAPLAAAPSGQFATRTLFVAEVEGEQDGGAQQNLREALWFAMEPSLRNAHIFKAVVTNGAADFRLDSAIVAHKELTGAISATSSILMVRYKLIETSTGAVVWRETITTHYDAPPSSGALATSLLFGTGNLNPDVSGANEGAVRDNLSRLIAKLSALSAARARG